MSESSVDNTVVVVETETIVAVNVPTIESVTVTEVTPNHIEVLLIEGVTPSVQVIDSDFEVRVYQGDLYFANIDEEILSGVVKKNDFIVTDPDVNLRWNLSSDARTLLHVMINQIDYVKFCAIDPVGSGRVVYTVPVGGYEPEVGDSVIIYWLR